MHELAIATSLIEQVTARAQALGAVKVKTVTIKVGEYSGVCTESLLFAYEPLAEGTLLEGSQLIIQTAPFILYCPQCQKQWHPAQFRRSCEQCSSRAVEIVSGRELDLVNMEVTYTTKTEIEGLPNAAASSALEAANGDKNYV
ncbi:MAG: hydrogenase maturation nickel metallochaperone HypA [Bacteriovoracaceae bacterium]|nr:hydrogenase maturation nickel metallochaperone HypA [Bacteriovoracaceae bacterium]